MLVEPFRETTIIARKSDDNGDQQIAKQRRPHSAEGAPLRFHWRIVQMDASGVPLENTPPVMEQDATDIVSVVLKQAGSQYVVIVEERYADGSVANIGEARISCKYVRREIRDLKQADRDELFDTMQEFYTVPNDEGKAKYGAKFNNYQLATVYHNAVVSRCMAAGVSQDFLNRLMNSLAKT